MKRRVSGIAFVVFALSLAGCGSDEREEPAAAVGRITCTPTMLRIDTPRVLARPDGIHLNARVSGRPAVSLTVAGRPVRGQVVVRLPAGTVRLKCSHGDTSLYAGFTVVERPPA